MQPQPKKRPNLEKAFSEKEGRRDGLDMSNKGFRREAYWKAGTNHNAVSKPKKSKASPKHQRKKNKNEQRISKDSVIYIHRILYGSVYTSN